jgi:hypothetical protein
MFLILVLGDELAVESFYCKTQNAYFSGFSKE